MGMISEFKAFAMKGNVVDMAVGVILGGAFGAIVSSLVDKILMPPIGLAMSGIDFSKLGLILKAAELGADGKEIKPAVMIGYGDFINAVIKFIIVAICLFMVIKAMNTAMKKDKAPPPPPPPGPTREQALLMEIRDLLSSRR